MIAQTPGDRVRALRGAPAVWTAILMVVSWALASSAAPLDDPTGEPVVSTFSIAAADTAMGIWGIAVASKFLAVGSVVPWARAGAGAVATQSYANTSFGPSGLEAMAAGASADAVLERLLADDPGRDHRQVGIVDARGRGATWTGSECMAWAGGRVGAGYAAQGNILTGPEVVDAMARAFEDTTGFLGDRLLHALEAGDATGGDSRGRQSAALLLVAAGEGYGGFNDILCDLRVDDHADPIVELRRIYDLWNSFHLVVRGYRLIEEGDFAGAIECGERLTRLEPDSAQSWYHLACYRARAGELDDGMRCLERALRLDASLRAQAAVDTDLVSLRSREGFRRLIEETR